MKHVPFILESVLQASLQISMSLQDVKHPLEGIFPPLAFLLAQH